MSMIELPIWKCIKCGNKTQARIKPIRCACGGDVLAERECDIYHNFNKCSKLAGREVQAINQKVRCNRIL